MVRLGGHKVFLLVPTGKELKDLIKRLDKIVKNIDEKEALQLQQDLLDDAS